ncbi:FMN-dependent NADPH-azoreductase [Hyphomicrobiales bacterium]|nr:FMN-dependent NADPH-azoreductase [Hyphomicrobiales bacterium]CAH1675609.1 FMN-dependent NADPH-azoreductase [Hyphomicrobiales bacterium]
MSPDLNAGMHRVTRRKRPLIVGIGGTMAPSSSSEWALRCALKHAENFGTETVAFCASDLELPLYSGAERQERARRLIDAIRCSDGIIISTPAYHGAMSGMIKNALDYIEDLRDDERPYLSGRTVGIIVSAYGDQAMGTALSSVRTVVHALRGWPTPLGVTMNASAGKQAEVSQKLAMLAEQVVSA